MLCDVVMCTLNPKLEDHLNLRKHKMLNKISEMLLLLLLLLWARGTQQIFSVLSHSKQDRRGGIRDHCQTFCTVDALLFRTSKVVSTKPSPFHLQIFCGNEAAAAPRP